MDQFLYYVIFLGYFVLVLSTASACGLIGYFVGLFIGWTLSLLLYPIIGEAGAFLPWLFGSTGFCLGCLLGAVLAMGQISGKRTARSLVAKAAIGDIAEEPAEAEPEATETTEAPEEPSLED